MTSPQLKRMFDNRRTEAEAREDSLITIRLTMTELVTMMHALESAKDKACQDVLFTTSHESYPPPTPRTMMLREEGRKAAKITRDRIAELCEMVTEIWRENR